MSSTIQIPMQDQSLTLYEARPASGRGPGVVVLHAWWGLNDFFKEVCDRLAAAGFLTVAPDMFQGKVADTPDEAQKLAERAESAGSDFIRQSIEASVDYLLSHPDVQGEHVGVAGFSFGAAWALELSALKPEAVSAVVIFYGTGDADISRSQAAYQGHFAEFDEWEPAEYVQHLEQSLRQAGRPVTFYTYPSTGHWFLEANRPENFSEEAANLAWDRMVKFLHERLG